MAFSDTVKREVILRQKGLCACCGELLADLQQDTPMLSLQFHHVVTKVFGTDDTAANCVALCSDTDPRKGNSSKDGCHGRAHCEYRYGSGYVAPPDYFPYSHGLEGSADHLNWVRQVSVKFKGYVPPAPVPGWRVS
jgi:hypothetical protein